MCVSADAPINLCVRFCESNWIKGTTENKEKGEHGEAGRRRGVRRFLLRQAGDVTDSH